ncbi:unnamed protein product [Closterium sp. Yama58-4]|nr:unnamed protein product [Closterium sp. Yama58-4]
MPPSFFNLSSLTDLDLHVNFDKLPDEFDKLISLTKLTLDTSWNAHLPESFGHLTSLTELNFINCPLTRLPDSFGGLKSLVRLSLGVTILDALPDSIGQLQNLQEFHLKDNYPITSLPDSFFQLSLWNVNGLFRFQPHCPTSFLSQC